MEIEVGRVTHFYTKISVAVVKLSDTLRIGDKIHIKGHTTDFYQTVTSMQIQHKPVQEAHAGDEIGLKVEQRVRENDVVYKVVE